VIWLLLLLACGAHTQRTGLILTESGRARLVEQDGRETALVLTGEARAVNGLGGCTVELAGNRGLKGLVVDTWAVKEAGFGSEPFVGRLRMRGGALFLEDRTTQTRLRLAAGANGGLERAVGGIVMIEGLIVGQQVLRVITWRGLLAPGAETAEPR
jgi:hypothetical protein